MEKKLTTQKIGVSNMIRYSIMGLGLLLVIMILFCPFIIRYDKLLLNKIFLSGLQLISTLGTGKITLYAQNSTFIIDIPSFVPICLCVILSLVIITIVLSIFMKKKVSISAIPLAFASVITIGFFIVTIFDSKITALNFSNENVPFYKLFDYGIGIVLIPATGLISTIIAFFVKEKNLPQIKKYWFLYLMLFIPFVLLLVFSLYPILLQTVLSFKEYRFTDGIWGSDWVGFKQFRKIFTDPDMGRIILNTVKISLLRLVFGMVPPIVLSLMIFEIKKTFIKRSIQTITYIPHFFSWVIIYGIVFAFLSPNGIVNNLRLFFGDRAIEFLTTEKYFIPLLIISDVWKELGWGTILYLAALSSIDNTLYEAAAIDGAGPICKLKNITLPAMTSIIVFLFIMAIGNVLKGAGSEQILLFANTGVMNKAEVIDTWVYWQGLGNYQYSLGAAVSFAQSFFGLILVMIANKLSIKLVGRGLW